MTDRQININGNDIHISDGFSKDIEVNHVFELKSSQPTINVYENDKLVRKYLLETLITNPDLTGQFFHSSVRLLKNSAVMIDGIISNEPVKFSTWTDKNYEAIRLQPFFLSDKETENVKLKGQGLFQRGLHFSGTVTPGGVRAVCICDNCEKSFTVQHFHSGFSEAQYFYSTDSKQTLVVQLHQIKNIPAPLQKDIDTETLKVVEEQLPEPTIGKGKYKYYNPFRCPHCSATYIDFENNKDIRPTEYYGIYLINCEMQRLDDKQKTPANSTLPKAGLKWWQKLFSN